MHSHLPRARRNRLAGETSPYLLQHADNPVDWYPWGPEALERARAEDKPILLSIGYSACHWCHVMAHESFEDAATAALMNELFVNVKVDREERPDLDRIYQVAHQMLTQRGGGWPLTMFLSPRDQRPFFGGTYFPPSREVRHAGVPRRAARAWRSTTASTATTSAGRATRWSRCSARCCRRRPLPRHALDARAARHRRARPLAARFRRPLRRLRRRAEVPRTR